MKKGFSITILFTVFYLFANTLLAQRIHYQLLQEPNPETNTADVEFTPNLPDNTTFVRWEINGEEFTNTTPTYSFSISSGVEFDVTLYYTNPDLQSISATINVLAPLFRVEPDKELGHLASLKKVFRSGFNITDNIVELIDPWRFDWDIDGTKPDYITFPSGFGDYPNVYHTFNNGGTYTINLRVTSIATTNYTAIFSKTIELIPVFGTNKIDFEPLPNVFTPNGDGVNDNFEVIASGTTTLLFQVFSRSGALIYRHEGNVIKWNGRNHLGQAIPEGIYYYVLEDIGEKKYNPAKGFFYIYNSVK